MGELKIRVLSRPDAPAPTPAVRVQPNATSAPPAAASGQDVRLGARVREALCCPYCRESLTPEELTGVEAGAEREVERTGRIELVQLLSLSFGGLVCTLVYGPFSNPAAGGFGLATLFAPLLFLAIRGLSRRYGVAELMSEAWQLWKRGETHVDGEDGVCACARPGCGAVYHTECWDECKASYGACAVYACGSREASGISHTQLRLRGLRLMLAAFLFPQRLIDSVRKVDESDDGELARLRTAIRERAKAKHGDLWGSDAARHSTAFNLLQMGMVAGGAGIGLAIGLYRTQSLGTHPDRGPWLLAWSIGLSVFAAFGLYAASWLGAIALYAAKSLLSSEFSALARLGQRGAFLSRSSSKK